MAMESPQTEKQAQAAIEREGAYGSLQIREICIEDTRRFAGAEMVQQFGRLLEVQDMVDDDMARWVCTAYLSHYGHAYTRSTGKPPTYEVLCRIWNGGPRGYKRQATQGYWDKAGPLLQGLK